MHDGEQCEMTTCVDSIDYNGKVRHQQNACMHSTCTRPKMTNPFRSLYPTRLVHTITPTCKTRAEGTRSRRMSIICFGVFNVASSCVLLGTWLCRQVVVCLSLGVAVTAGGCGGGGVGVAVTAAAVRQGRAAGVAVVAGGGGGGGVCVAVTAAVTMADVRQRACRWAWQ